MNRTPRYRREPEQKKNKLIRKHTCTHKCTYEREIYLYMYFTNRFCRGKKVTHKYSGCEVEMSDNVHATLRSYRFNVDIYLPLVTIAGLTGCLHNKCTHVYVHYSTVCARYLRNIYTLIHSHTPAYRYGFAIHFVPFDLNIGNNMMRERKRV